MKDTDCVRFLQWLLPQLQMRWPGFRKVRRQVCKRIDRRLVTLELPDVEAYQQWIAAHPEELRVLDGYCLITISRFYRDRSVFDFMRDEILPELAAAAQASGRSEVKCWSAGCASGEEPYTVNIVWKRAIAPRVRDVSLKILATDRNPWMLGRARRGCYPSSSLTDFPSDWVADCFVAVGGEYRVRTDYRAGIVWLQQDIREQMSDEVFDVILCRHLAFTYFDEPLQLRVLGKLVARLRSGGFLVTGKREPLPASIPQLTVCKPRMGVHRKLQP